MEIGAFFSFTWLLVRTFPNDIQPKKPSSSGFSRNFSRGVGLPLDGFYQKLTPRPHPKFQPHARRHKRRDSERTRTHAREWVEARTGDVVVRR